MGVSSMSVNILNALNLVNVENLLSLENLVREWEINRKINFPGKGKTRYFNTNCPTDSPRSL